MTDYQALRQTIRKQRQALPETTARHCAAQLAQHLCTHPLLRNSRHIATYIAADGEIDPAPLMECLWSMGRTLYLPVLVPFAHGKLWFARYRPGDLLVANHYGIPEPQRRHLDTVLAWGVAITTAALHFCTGVVTGGNRHWSDLPTSSSIKPRSCPTTGTYH